MSSRSTHHAALSLREYLSSVETSVQKMDQHRLVQRLWEKDHTLWKPDPTEIADRLGWLSISESMVGQCRP